ncbi:type I secretion system permease/ATPase [Legionella maioricensis]|uniref:Type I secretion system permease/ATPase n=1 Tax=Legionella maioricensis TaxID=2896528 RepID=A0A9X2D212_9GAMM|nr:type I secretion system permease/ATPase [Legionella maioricensis]MCL9684976.1 type I secretion system permease/ATPase [Legionella maioricensis]MCL9688127.1 type I secretion system permease/ATPase [Legionella maioricensis]
MVTLRKQSWSHVDLGETAENDSLLACLVLLTRYYQNPFSPLSLIARLPLVNNKLTVELFVRSAARASLDAEVQTLKLDQIEDANIPAVLMKKDGNAVLLILDDDGKRVVLDPKQPDMTLDIKEIAPELTQQVIFVDLQFKHTERSQETLAQQPKNWFWKVMLKSWPLYSEVLIASLLVNIFALVIPLFTMNVYDRVVPNHATDTMWVLASGVALVFIFDTLLKTLRSYFIDVANKHTDLELSATIFQQVLGLKMETRPKSVGSLANTVQSFELFRDFITSSTMTVLVDLPFAFIFLFVIYLIGGNLFWIPFIVVPIIFLIGLILQWPLIRLTRKAYQYSAEKQATLFESLAAIETVKTTGAESILQSRWEKIIDESSKNSMHLRFVSNSSMNLTNLAQQIATIAIVIAGVYMISNNELTTGALIACTILTGRAMAPMAVVSSLFTRYFQSVNALQSLNKIMQLDTDINENTKFLHRPALKGDIEFRQVFFHYPGDEINALSNLNFKIKVGDRIAIIGRVGSGKSTLGKLLLKLFLPSEGTILMDGTDYKQINPDDLRQQIGYVPQDVVLLYGSVRDNICVGAPFIRDSELIKAAEIAGVTSFTNNHPKGFDRQVGEKGAELSGGQRQAVAMARALIMNPNVLLLDEPTSSMDDNSERQIKARLNQYLTNEHTLILITHKISMLELVNRIIVLEDGKIIADGSKEAVINALKSGSVRK